MRFILSLLILFCSVVSVSAQLKFLALGDSYTIGESVEEDGRWPNQLQKKLNALGVNVSMPMIIARTGWRTDELSAAIESADLTNDFDLVGLLIGVNNQYQGKSVESYKPEFEQLLKRAIELANGDKSRVFVVSIPDYGFTPFGASKKDKISKELDEYNQANKKITEDHGVNYYYITDISRSDDSGLVANDNLHPSAKQYGLWADLIAADVKFFKSL
ncbi:SGNH/GDSL hydrolase family protein [Fulvivirga lutimaris]|uniref:SGNH/GDSL hydrolase family protein n=1 Tax=Fulvivirga lutimaris TaxID=1819566 RepID=UPI0012BB4B32|nr:SGNH/GDSL hydrolase family protein [Fulvivirga lutimaris]MTI39786.1 SGNH/GDSL hydrolase family protein [Fulvivirga lutimaris]